MVSPFQSLPVAAPSAPMKLEMVPHMEAAIALEVRS